MTVLEIETVLKLPRSEKLQIMETLWADLSQSEVKLESPDWHHQALEETEQRVNSGCETVLDWSDAKQNLRARFK